MQELHPSIDIIASAVQRSNIWNE